MELLRQMRKWNNKTWKPKKTQKKQSQVKIQRFEIPMMALRRKKRLPISLTILYISSLTGKACSHGC